MKTRNALIIAAGIAVGLALMPVGYVYAANSFSTTKIVTGTNSATCPTGYRVVGGGASGMPSNTSSSSGWNLYTLNGSYASGSKWIVNARKVHIQKEGLTSLSMTTTTQSVTAYAVCIK
jgi:hypothetical protein